MAAVHAVDQCVQKVVDAILATGGACIITADHGNSEMMVDPESGAPFTAHTTNPVPVIYVDNAHRDAKLREGGRLADIAPTMLKILELPQPEEMTGESIIL